MMRLAAIVLLSVVSTSGASADTFKMDGPSPLKLVRDRGTELSRFEGKVTVVGRFIARWEADVDGELYLFTAIRPTRVSAGLLPYDAARGPVQEVWLYDNGTLLSQLLSADVRRNLMAKRISSAEVDAQVMITDYQTAIDCDVRTYAARFVSGEALSTAEVTEGPYEYRVC